MDSFSRLEGKVDRIGDSVDKLRSQVTNIERTHYAWVFVGRLFLVMVAILGTAAGVYRALQ